MGKDPRAMRHPAGLGIGRAIIEPRNACSGDGAGAHRAGFERDIESVAGKSFRVCQGTGGADSENLGMCRRIVQLARPVACLRHDLPIGIDHHRAHRHLATRACGACLSQGGGHMALERHGPFVPGDHRFRKPGNCVMRRRMSIKPPIGERIAKVIARAGIASRREAERLIEAGRVTVNGRRIDRAALNVTLQDKITVDGRALEAPEPARLWLYHKPVGRVTTSRDEQGRPTIYDGLPEDMPRVMSVGRLDLNSEGLLLLTNDGALKRKLELPSTGWLRRYRVRVNGRPTDATFDPLRKGLVVDGEMFQPMIVTLDRQQGANAWITVAIREGKNREIRRAMDAVGLVVNRLIRLSYGPFQLGQLKPGAVEEIRPRVLRDQLGTTEEPEAVKSARPKPQRRRRN